MALFKRTVRDGNGSIVPLADLYVRNELNSALVTQLAPLLTPVLVDFEIADNDITKQVHHLY